MTTTRRNILHRYRGVLHPPCGLSYTLISFFTFQTSRSRVIVSFSLLPRTAPGLPTTTGIRERRTEGRRLSVVSCVVLPGEDLKTTEFSWIALPARAVWRARVGGYQAGIRFHGGKELAPLGGAWERVLECVMLTSRRHSLLFKSACYYDALVPSFCFFSVFEDCQCLASLRLSFWLLSDCASLMLLFSFRPFGSFVTQHDCSRVRVCFGRKCASVLAVSFSHLSSFLFTSLPLLHPSCVHAYACLALLLCFTFFIYPPCGHRTPAPSFSQSFFCFVMLA